MATFKVVFTALLLSVPSLTLDECRVIQNCSCSKLPTEIEYSCPSFPDEPKVVLKVQSNKLEVNCMSYNETQTVDLGIESVKRFAVKFCQAPENLKQFMTDFGVTSAKVLSLEYMTLSNITLSKTYLSGFEDLARLKIENSELSAVEEDVFENTPSLIEIRIKGNKITSLPDIFTTVPDLEILDLSRNELKELPHRAFRNLTNLEILHLWGNNLALLPSDILSDVPKLTSLELSNNALKTLPDTIFSSLTNLKQLNLDGNKLEEIPSEIFKNNKNLELVRLSWNPNVTLSRGLFSNLPFLKELRLMNNALKSIPENLFFNSSNMEKIWLADNEIENLPKTVFSTLKNLKVIDLSGNKLEYLDGIFDDLINLKELYLKNNLISSITSNTLKSLRSLNILNLSKNKIADIHYAAFLHMGNLIDLDMSHNQISFNNSFAPLNYCLNLQSLILHHNSITEFENDFIFTKLDLLTLDLSYNRITEIEIGSLFSSNSHRLSIDLSNNNISQVHFAYAKVMARVNQEVNLKIDISNNPINCDCGAYDLSLYYRDNLSDELKRIVELSEPTGLNCASPPGLFNVSLQNIPLEYLTCPLQKLMKNVSCPEKCVCEWRPSDRTIVVDCAEQNLTVVPQIYLPQYLPEIGTYNDTEIHLEKNLLTSPPMQTDSGYENITKLFLSYNEIEELNWVPPKIKVLQVDHNNLTKINQLVLESLNKSGIHTVTLDNNPWTCDCFSTNLTKFLRVHLKQIYPAEIRCHGSDKKLIDLTEKDLCPTYINLILITSVIVVGICFVAAIAAALFYKHQQEIKVWLFAHNICLWWVTEEEIDKDKKYDAFICFSNKDDDFVVKELVPVLENGPESYKLCIHYRDWIAGEFITIQIAESVANSRRTIIVLSRNFLESVWGKMEFRIAHKQSMAEGRARVIMILYGDINPNTDFDEELKAYIKTNTYVKWGEPYFWNKLKYALPHSQNKLNGKFFKSQKHTNILQTLDDKFSLIIPATPDSGTTPPVMPGDTLIKGSPLDFVPNVNKLPETIEGGLNPLLTTSKDTTL